MRTRIATVALAAALTAVTIGWISAPSAQEADILGAWIVTSEDNSHQRGLFIFTEANYSQMWVRGDEPRAQFGDDVTDEEALAAFRSITANSGRYTRDGNQITYEAYMANNPNYMGGWPENDQTMTVEVDGGRMTLTTAQGRVFMLQKVG